MKNARQHPTFKKTWKVDGTTVTFLMGSYVIIWGASKGCKSAELLAVKDSDRMNKILVRLYQK